MASRDSFFSASEPGIRSLLGLESDLEYLARVGGPRASIMGLNAMRKTIKARTARKVWEDTRYLPLVDSKGRKLTNRKVKSGIKLAHVRKRIYVTQANRYKPYAVAKGYIRDIPAIKLTSTSRKGETVTKGKIRRKKVKGVRGGADVGGVSIGGVIFDRAFLQFVQRSQMPHVFRREGQKTWKPGQHGWGRKAGTTGPYRAPYDVVSVPLKYSFLEHFYPTVLDVIEKRSSLEYNKALGVVGGKLMKSGSKY